MRHEHLVVTVEAGTKARVDDDLGPGESLEAWVADAIERKLAEEGTDDASGDEDEERGDADESDEEQDDYDKGFEFVDDCRV